MGAGPDRPSGGKNTPPEPQLFHFAGSTPLSLKRRNPLGSTGTH
ncbi:hypothetical protein PDE_08276 [Penicillium oxalicum 114-2]|uniref:Uncharacterized protein n=1 Tax=Penicillium oxalicum (strain 114-2 / CGMCC 5302) TaxID=933388 RepID=S7ZSD9_PENO1|nr:hypothetical protein PDE_08276 [Penicillium oxalicum 114-2]